MILKDYTIVMTWGKYGGWMGTWCGEREIPEPVELYHGIIKETNKENKRKI